MAAAFNYRPSAPNTDPDVRVFIGGVEYRVVDYRVNYRPARVSSAASYFDAAATTEVEIRAIGCPRPLTPDYAVEHRKLSDELIKQMGIPPALANPSANPPEVDDDLKPVPAGTLTAGQVLDFLGDLGFERACLGEGQEWKLKAS